MTEDCDPIAFELFNNASFSIADVCLGPIIDRIFGFPITLPALPGIRAWHAKVTARPAYQKSKG